jgi:hypothetical protein
MSVPLVDDAMRGEAARLHAGMVSPHVPGGVSHGRTRLGRRDELPGYCERHQGTADPDVLQGDEHQSVAVGHRDRSPGPCIEPRGVDG